MPITLSIITKMFIYLMTPFSTFEETAAIIEDQWHVIYYNNGKV